MQNMKCDGQDMKFWYNEYLWPKLFLLDYQYTFRHGLDIFQPKTIDNYHCRLLETDQKNNCDGQDIILPHYFFYNLHPGRMKLGL